MNPPLRTAADRDVLIEALLDGTIEAVATDHAPHSREEKDVPFEAAPFGVTGLETAFASLYTALVESGLVPLEILLERMSAGPARIFGLDRPRIAVGAPANLVLLSPDATWKVREDRFKSKSANSWLLGRRLQGQGRPHRRRRPDRVRGMSVGLTELKIRAEAPASPALGSGVSGFLVLEDGEVFPGESVGAPGAALGEAVFTTGMTGYQEVVTDPSFSGQIVCFTAPMVGNYGVAEHRAESAGPHASGVVMREARGPEWTDWLTQQRHPGADRHRHALAHPAPARARRAARCPGRGRARGGRGARADPQPAVDGRAGARRPGLDRGAVCVLARAMPASLSSTTGRSARSCGSWPRPARPSPSSRTTSTPRRSSPSTASCSRTGPGDPEPLVAETATVGDLLGRVPVLGICLGHQLLALATGLRTYKLPFGHRGANHPVLDRRTGKVLVTSQNHGFAVAPGDGRATSHESLYDGTTEGLDVSRAARPLGSVPPRGRARPARRAAALRRVGRGGARLAAA